MGILELLTIIFVILKLIGAIDWNWWLVFLPAIIAAAFYITWFLFATVFIGKTQKEIFKEFNNKKNWRD